MRMSVATSAVPASAGQFIELYRDYVIHLVHKQGIPSQDCEDVADDILLAELNARNAAGEEVGILALYDAGHISEHTGKPVTFRVPV